MTDAQNSPTNSTGEESWFCRDCEERLEIVYDEREDEDTPVVCGSCGGTNTGRIVTDGGRYTGVLGLVEGHGDVVAAALREGLNRYSKNRPEDVTDEDLAVLEELASEVEDL